MVEEDAVPCVIYNRVKLTPQYQSFSSLQERASTSLKADKRALMVIGMDNLEIASLHLAFES